MARVNYPHAAMTKISWKGEKVLILRGRTRGLALPLTGSEKERRIDQLRAEP
jgi:hypothetical protein